MARVELELPERFAFRTEIPVRIDDLNYAGHVGHDRLLTFTHVARARMFAERGWRELDVDGVGIAIVDAAAVYASEVVYGMTLSVEIAVADVRSRGCEMYYRLGDVANGGEVARAKTGIVFFDYRARKVAHVPPSFRAAFG